jgi:hypothetical protein
MMKSLSRMCEICYDSAVNKYEPGNSPAGISVMKSIASIFVNLVVSWAKAHRLPVVE